MRKLFSLFILLVICIGLVSILWIPTHQYRVVSLGTDAYATHYPLFGTRTISQEVSLQGSLMGVGGILVDMRRSHRLTPVLVTITTTEHDVLRTATIDPSQIHDDTVAWSTWDKPIAKQEDTVIITFAAPEATNQNPIGLRFDENNPSQFAVGVLEQVTIGKRLVTNVSATADLPRILIAFAASMLVSLMLVTPWMVLHPYIRWGIYGVGIGACLLLALSTRIYFMNHLYGASGGDPYNYLSITKSISHGENPFAGTKRLPGFPLLLLPAFVTSLDDVYFMRVISVLSSLGIAAMVILLARSINLHWSIGLLAAVLLLLQKDFFFTSTRPEPYSFYALLVITAVTLFFHLHRPRYQLLFSLVLGYAAMTRQEGFVLAMVLGMCTVLLWKTLWWKGYLRVILPAFILVLPFFIHNTIEFGNPFFTPYFEGERLQIVDSWGAFTDSMGATWGIFGSLWKSSWDELTRISLTNILLLSASVLTFFWGIVRTVRKPSWPGWLLGGASIVLMIATVWLRLINKSLFDTSVMIITAGIVLVSPLIFLVQVKWKGGVILAVLLSQMAVALWFHPFAKHFQQDYAFVMLMVAATVAVIPTIPLMDKPSWRFLSLLPYYTALMFPVCLVAIGLWKHVDAFVDATNEDTALDSVVSRAIAQTRQLPGPYGFDQAYLPARLYFDHDAYFLLDPNASVSEQDRWLHENNIRTLVVTTDSGLFTHPDPQWLQIGHYKAAGKDEAILESFVYTIPE